MSKAKGKPKAAAPAAEGPPKPRRGRPPKERKQLGRKAEVDALIEGHALRAFENLRLLADGGAIRTKRKYVTAGSQTIKAALRDGKDGKGELVRDKNGKVTLVDVPMYPTLDPDALVLVEEVREVLGPDFKANEYLMNRFGGRPAEAEREKDDELDINEAVAQAHGLKDEYIDPDEASPDAIPPG